VSFVFIITVVAVFLFFISVLSVLGDIENVYETISYGGR